jgi:hypothetical protein
MEDDLRHGRRRLLVREIALECGYSSASTGEECPVVCGTWVTAPLMQAV